MRHQGCFSVTNSRAKPQQTPSVESMLIHQGWFTAPYSQHFLAPPRRLVPCLGLRTTRVRQLRSGSFPGLTADTKCNEQPSQATSNSVSGQAILSHPVVVLSFLSFSFICFIFYPIDSLYTVESVKYTVSVIERIFGAKYAR